MRAKMLDFHKCHTICGIATRFVAGTIFRNSAKIVSIGVDILPSKCDTPCMRASEASDRITTGKE
jgi:hypothetical protein